MMEPLTWNKIDISTHLTPNMTSFHVFTKDFMCLYTTSELERFNDDDAKEFPYYAKFNKLYDLMHGEEEIDNKYLMDMDRIIPFVFSIRETRKLHEAIEMQTGGQMTHWNLNYLRFYPYKGEYIVTNDCEPIEWNTLMTQSFVGAS